MVGLDRAPSALTVPAASSATRSAAWPDLILVVGLALLWRTLLFNGAFGSDDTVYLARAFEIAEGRWTSADYNGALRYGFNIPAGLMVAMFGRSLVAANLWPLMCSLAEVALVYVFLRELAGRRAAVVGALLMGAAPLHIAVATRIHADPVVSFFLTAAFVATFKGLRARSEGLCLAAGLALGGVYWSKELAPVTYFAFVPLLWYFRGFWRGVGWAIAGLLIMLFANGVLMQVIAGDPLHPIRVVLGAMGRNFIHGGQGEDSPWYYIPYLFLDVRHVGLLGWLAVLGLVQWGASRQRGDPQATASDLPAAGFAVAWLAGMLLILSVFPVSLVPLRFTMKQSNYISLFLAPLVIVATLGLHAWRGVLGRTLLGVSLCLGLLLAGLQQADYRAFTANSKAIARDALRVPGPGLVGSTNNSSMAYVQSLISRQVVPVVSFKEIREGSAATLAKLGSGDLIAVLDPQTLSWFAGQNPVTGPLSCWQWERDLAPEDLGLGNHLAASLAHVVSVVPGQVPSKVAAALSKLGQPAPARVYRVPKGHLWCD